MELTQFLIWVLIIWLVTFLISWFVLRSINFKQRNSGARVLQLALILSLFIALIFGLIFKPSLTYNNCKTYTIKYSIFTLPVINCDQALWLSLLFSYLAGYIILYLLLFNMHIEQI